jgi:ACR3 family arsenite efflux pump ArsB
MTMQRFALALVLALALVALAGVALSALTRRLASASDAPEAQMPKIAFFLLLCVMAYAIAQGAS